MRKCYKCSGYKYDIDSEMIICKTCNGKGKKDFTYLLGNLKDEIDCSNCYGKGYSFSHECE